MKKAKLWIALAIFPASALYSQDLTGTWQGISRNPDTKEELRTVLKIASSEGNPIKANFYSIDQTYLVFPATLTVEASVVKMKIPGIGAEYTAKLSADGNSMTGTLKGFSVPVTWSLKRVGPEEAWTIPKPPAPPRPLKSADPVFEVATVKLSRPDTTGRGGGRGGRLQGGKLSMTNMTLMDLVTLVYDVHSHQVIGAPAWATSGKFDITAKAEGEGQPNQEQLKIMVSKLLADRFHWTIHKERKELPVYSLSVAKGGVKISKNDGTNPTTGIIFRGPGSVLFNNVTMAEFCRMLQSSVLDRPVIDQTAVDGKYDFSLVWTPDQLTPAATNPNALAPGDNPLPDVYTAIQQQLGLKIDATKMRVEVLVVDKVEKPSDN